VHLLGHVGRGVVDHHSLGVIGRQDPEVRVGELVGHRLGQHIGAQPEVDKPRTRDLRRLAEVGDLQLGHDLGRHIAGTAALGIGQAERHVGLEMAELRLGGGPELRVDAGDGFDPSAQQRRKRGHSRPLFHR
jgi:hypothetical protein